MDASACIENEYAFGSSIFITADFQKYRTVAIV